VVSTPAGDVEVGIPKLRTGSSFPELLEPRRRVDRALWAVIMTAYITGTSTRRVDDLVRALGCDSGVSESTVSRIFAGIDADVAVLRTRRLDHQPFVHVWLDATYVHVREHRHVVSKAVVIATGLRADGHREVLGVDVGDSERTRRSGVSSSPASTNVVWPVCASSSATPTPVSPRRSAAASKVPPGNAAGSTRSPLTGPRSRFFERWPEGPR
jgi:hypothetical protein